MRTIIEPFRIKSVEPLHPHHARAARKTAQKPPAIIYSRSAPRDILIDLLTDSGTSAMSTEQWAAIMRGDESYAGSESFYRFESAVRSLTGFRYVIPTHQGRAAERILFSILCKPGHVVPNNTHFDTTRANIEFNGARAVDLPVAAAADTQARVPFKGNLDVEALEQLLQNEGAERSSAGDDHRHKQFRRRPARFHGEHPGGAEGDPALRRPAVFGRVPVRRERLVHQARRAGLCET